MSRAASIRAHLKAGFVLSATLLIAYACAGPQRYRDESLGSKLFYSRCRSCHAPVDPASKTREFWDSYLDRYAQRAKLTSDERDSVMAFVLRATENAGEKTMD